MVRSSGVERAQQPGSLGPGSSATRSGCELGQPCQPIPGPDRAGRRCGLAAAGMAALRTENPGFAWHTLGGHIDGSPAFWDTIGADVPGGYRQRDVCEHVTPGG